MLGSAPPGYNTPSVYQQNIGSLPKTSTQGTGLSPLATSQSSYMPPSSTMIPSSTFTPSSYFQPSSQMQPSNIPQNPDPNPQVQNQISMIVKALQGGMR